MAEDFLVLYNDVPVGYGRSFLDGRAARFSVQWIDSTGPTDEELELAYDMHEFFMMSHSAPRRVMPHAVIGGKEYYLWACVHDDCSIEQFQARRSAKDLGQGEPTGWSWDSCPGCQRQSNTLLSPSEEVIDKEK